MNDQSRHLAAAATALFLVAFAVYGIGIYLIQTEICKHVGPNVAMFAVAVSIFATGIVASRAVVVRSAASWVSFLGASLISTVLYFFVGVLALPGCSGV
jgi:hypothetical protein